MTKIKQPYGYDPILMYDVVGVVLKLQGAIKATRKHDRGPYRDATYADVGSELIKNGVMVNISIVVEYLRYAEKLGYIHGHSAFYQKHGGGCTQWRFNRWPPYPYHELIQYQYDVDNVPCVGCPDHFLVSVKPDGTKNYRCLCKYIHKDCILSCFLPYNKKPGASS